MEVMGGGVCGRGWASRGYPCEERRAHSARLHLELAQDARDGDRVLEPRLGPAGRLPSSRLVRNLERSPDRLEALWGHVRGGRIRELFLVPCEGGGRQGGA